MVESSRRNVSNDHLLIPPTDAEAKKLPLRLIDVLATISSSDKGNIIFQKGSSRGWNFHVISHTWSKGIRDLSEEIGRHVLQGQLRLPELQTSSAPSVSLLSSSSCVEEVDAYSHAFKDADFRRVSSYQELRQFLQLLAGDGVTHTWFDALCIDQTNLEEKSREICNMAAYYHCSEGCYVLTHGVGEGYQLWGKQEPRGLELPRWFSRVWTLQEFLLPGRLSFLVEGLDPRLLAFVDRLGRAKSKNGLCRCFCGLPQQEEHELMKSIWESDEQVDASWAVVLEIRDESMKKMESDDDGEETESFTSEGFSKRSAKMLADKWNSGSLSRREFLQLYMQLLSQDRENFEAYNSQRAAAAAAQHKEADLCPNMEDESEQKLEALSSSATADGVCAECQSVPMIRRAKMHQNDDIAPISESGKERSVIYLVDREVYLGIMQCDSRMTDPPPSGNTKGVQELRSLYARLSSTRPWKAWDVLVEVGKRNCSVEEDRVLGILGLLGIGGGELSQLRSGSGLQQQIMELARVCSLEMLVELCGMDIKCCCARGMSWAPDFHNPTCHDFWFTYVQRELRDGQDSLSVQIERVNIMASGALQLRAKVVAASVLPVTALPAPLQNTPFIKSCIAFDYGRNPCSHFIIIPPPPCRSLAGPSPAHVQLASTASTDPYVCIPLCCTIPDEGSPRIQFRFHPSFGHNSDRGSMQLPISINRWATATASTNDNGSLVDVINELCFDVEMVLLAGTNPTRCGDVLQLIVICLKSAAAAAATNEEELAELHKIGVLSFIVDPDDNNLDLRFHFENTGIKECTIGGFGEDVSAHVRINT